MKINNINNSPNFGRIIPIKYTSKNPNANTKENCNKSNKELEKVINNRKSELYNKTESENIKNYFHAILDTKDKTTPVRIIHVKNYGSLVLSDEDSTELTKIKTENSSPENAFKQVKTLVKSKIEDGKNYKLDSEIEVFFPDKCKKEKNLPRIECITYSTIGKYYTAAKDGHILKEEKETTMPTQNNVFENCYLNFQTLKI